MSDRTARALFEGEAVSVWMVECRSPRGARAPTEYVSSSQLVLPRRGVFAVQSGRRSFVADVSSAVLFPAGSEYRVSHPAGDGDECLVLGLAGETVDELFPGVLWRAARVDPTAQLRAGLLAGSHRWTTADSIAVEELALGLVASLARTETAPRAPSTAAKRAAHRRVDRVLALLAANPGHAWRIARLAELAGCSPFHLAREFRSETGSGIHRHLVRLRLGMALARIADGETDLARLAVDLGFAHHSHLTSTVRAAFGTRPRDFRAALEGGDPMRAFVERAGWSGVQT